MFALVPGGAAILPGMIAPTETEKTGTGSVIWFDAKHGCGFIKCNDKGPDLFVRPAVNGASFDAGDRIEYTLTTGILGNREVLIRAKR